MQIRFFIISLLIITSFYEAVAQKTYGLNDCIGIGLEKNFSLILVRNNETIAKNNYTKGNAGYLPTLDLNSRYGGTLNNTTLNNTDGSQDITKGTHNNSATAGITLGLTLFDGFNVQTSYKKLGELKKLGALNTQMAVENLIADIISGYYNYILQVQLQNNMEYAVILSKERLRIDEDRYLLGSNSKLQVLQSRVYLNADSSRLSRQTEVVRAAQIRQNTLMAAEDLDAPFISQDTSIEVNHDLLFEDLLEKTLSKNTNLMIAAKNQVISEHDYKLITSRTYPYLNLSTGYNYNLYTFSTGTTETQITNGMNYGLNLGINLFDGFNQRRNITNSAIDRMNQELKYRDVEQSIKAELITIYHVYSNNLRLIMLEQQNLQTATENLEIALERYKLGSLSGIDLREVQKSLLDARESLLSVQFQTKIAEISLQLIAGEIMEYYQ